MKKIFLTLSISMSIFLSTSAQEILSKKGEPYLPEEGDWAIGVDVAPFFQYVGNLANAEDFNESPGFDYAYPVQIFGKWFRSNDLAWRGRIRFLGLNNSTHVGYVGDDLNTDPNNPYKQVEDKKQMSRFNTTLAFGMEKRKGKTRLQGFYGAEAFLSFASGSDKYTYGNDLTVTNTSPSTFNFDNFNTSPPNGYRATEVKYGTSFSIGVRPFIGAEYFLFPKISIGGEFGYNLAFSSIGDSEVTSEYISGTGTVENSTVNLPQNNTSTFRMDNDNLSGSIRLMMHF